MAQRPDWPRNGRPLHLYGGILFVLVGGAAAIALNRSERPRAGPIPPVAITGRVVSLVHGVKGGRVEVVLRPSGPSVKRERVKTDHFGDFQIRSDYRGLVDVFVPPDPFSHWISRPLRNTSIPTATPVEIVLIEAHPCADGSWRGQAREERPRRVICGTSGLDLTRCSRHPKCFADRDHNGQHRLVLVTADRRSPGQAGPERPHGVLCLSQPSRRRRILGAFPSGQPAG